MKRSGILTAFIALITLMVIVMGCGTTSKEPQALTEEEEQLSQDIAATPEANNQILALTDDGTVDDNTGVFYTRCTADITAPVDPIVHPGMPGMSHMHQFFGAKNINANTTADSIRGKATTCAEKGDTAGYWIPVTYATIDGVKTEVKPIRIVARYGSGGRGRIIQPFPPGLKMVAGAILTTPVQPGKKIDWSCLPGNPYLFNPNFLPCVPGAATNARVDFQDCWDGVNLDSPDHRSHMADSRLMPVASGFLVQCPPTHPVPVPSIRMQIQFGKAFPVTTERPGIVTLASGESNSMHGDFLNGWVQSRLVKIVDECINKRITTSCVPNS